MTNLPSKIKLKKGQVRENMKQLLKVMMLAGLTITGLVMSPVKASASSSTASEVSITQNINFADKVSVSIERQVEITQEWHLVDQLSGVIVVRAPASSIPEIIRQVFEEAVLSFWEKITTYGHVFWQSNSLIKWPDWPWIPVEISLAILSVVTIGWRRFSRVPLKLLFKN